MTYAGDVTPEQAWQALSDDPGAVLVDVRTCAEWTWVGVPDVSPLGKQLVTIEWSRFPEGTVNERFAEELGAAGVAPDQAVYFLCRSGVRSALAAEAATRAGWTQSHNILEGFEGPHDARRHRTLSGWKVAGLPWLQG